MTPNSNISTPTKTTINVQTSNRTYNKHLRIAYAIQNVGGINLSLDVGDGVPVKNTLRGLRKAGHQVSCLKLTRRNIIGIDDISQLGDIWYSPLGLTGKRPFLSFESGVRYLQRKLKLPYFGLFDTYRFYEACQKVLPQYDLCHEHNGLFCLGAALACRRLEKPYVLTFSADPLFELELLGQPLRGLHALVARWEAKFTYKMADKIICVSKPAKKHLEEVWQVPAEKIVVMPNGVDLDLFGKSVNPQTIQSELGIEDNPVICFVGGFQKWHGLEELLDSFTQVLVEAPKSKLLLVGDGPARPAVEKKISEHNLYSSVTITGLIPQTRVPEMLAVANVVVLPYPKLPKDLWFSPLKLYEYMAAGKAIVASNMGQIADVIKNRHTGMLIEPGNVTELAQTLLALIKSPDEQERLGQNARKQAIEQHSWEQYINRLEDIYYSVL